MPASARALARQPDLTSWLSKTEAADALRTSTKSIERMAHAGELRCGQRPRAGRKPEPVYDPEQIGGLMRQRELQPLALGDGMTPRAMLMPAASATRFVDLEQGAAYSGLSAALLRRMIAEEKLPALRDGRTWKVRREDLDQI